MGVSGSGKSTIGALLAAHLGVPFLEGDDLHSSSSIAKMRAGRPLDDADRAPWLHAINAWLCMHAGGGVASCSALKEAYRECLSRSIAPQPAFVLLEPPRAVLERRLAARTGHFMPAALLDSQLATLEPPRPDAPILRIRGEEQPSDIVEAIVSWLEQHH